MVTVGYARERKGGRRGMTQESGEVCIELCPLIWRRKGGLRQASNDSPQSLKNKTSKS